MTLIKAKFGLLVSLFTWSNMVFAAAPADQNFDAIAPQESAQQNNPSITFNGVIYSADTTSEVIRVDTVEALTGITTFSPITLGSGNGITSAWYNSSGTYFQFASVSNLNDFKLESLRAEVWGGGSNTAEVYTVTGYNDGNSVVSATVTFTADGTYGVGNAAIIYDRQTTPAEEANTNNTTNAGLLTFGSAWTGIDQVRFTAADGKPIAFMMDQIDFSDVDSTPPTVSLVSASTANGTYKVGDAISVQVDFSENVTVAIGTPQLTLETGTTDRTINYASGSGTSRLIFNYTVQAGDTAADLDYVSIGALTLNGATIRDGASNNANLDLASPGAVNSLGANKNIVIDGVVPVVSSVTASTANGTYKLGDIISIQVNFTEAVTVNTGGGTPQLTLETGATDRTVNYTSGSGTSTLTFNYTIQSGDLSSDLDYVATNSLSSNGGTIRDAAANNATLTLASPGAANSLGNNKAVVVDGAVPSVTSTAPDGGAVSTDTSVDFTVNFSESVSNISTDDFALGTTGGATGTIASVSASSGSSVTVTVSGISGNGTIKLNLNASTNISDAAGNSSPAAYTSGTTHTVAIPTAPDAPTIGAATAGDGQVSVAFTAPVNNGGSAITGYTVTSSPDGITAGGNGFTTSPITVTGLTNGTAYTFTVTATNAVGTSAASGASNSATPKGDQTITFAQPAAQNFGTTPTLTATAASATGTNGLTVSFSSSTTGVCTITTGGALTFVTAGSCTIDADQAGDAATNAAATVSRTFTVNAVVPGAPTIGTATAGDTQADVTFTAPASIGGAAITGYTVTSNPGGFTGTGAGSPITVTGLTNGVSYTFTVTATNSAGAGAASAASNSITPASPQTINFANPGSQSFGTSPDFSIIGGGASASSGLTVSFTSSTTGVCTITSGGILTFVAAGTCTINANQAGDSSYLPAPQVTRSFTVNPVVPGAPTIGTAIAGDTQASVAFVAPVNTGGTALTGYTVTVSPPDVAPVNGAASPIVVTGLTNGQAYTFTVTADNAAGTGASSGASNSITPAATQTITFDNPGPRTFGTSPTLTATSDSGLTPTFTSSTPAVCTITSLGALTFVAAGTCTINADQAGNGSYLPATQVSRSFTVNPIVPGAPVIGTATAGNAQATVVFSAPVATGGSAITGYTITASPGGVSKTATASPFAFTGLNNGTAYSFVVTATNAAGTGASSAASNTVTPVGSQVITFNNPGAQNFGTSPTLTATSDSGLTPIFTSATPAVCTITGVGALTFITAGSCTINADQAGNSSYLAAPQVSRTFTVNAVVPGAPVIGAATAGDAEATVVFSAPVISGGSVITGYTITASPGGVSKTATASPFTFTGLTNGTAYSFTVAATNSAGTGAVSAASNEVTPVSANQAPVITLGASTSVTMSEDASPTAFALTIAVTDADNDPLSWSISSAAVHGTASVSDGVVSYLPEANYQGSDSFEVEVSDGEASDSIIVNVLIAAVNDAPSISGTPVSSLDQDTAYSFVPTASDIDSNDMLTFSISNKPGWASFDTATGALTGTPAGSDTGITLGIVISVSDGTASAALPAFDLEVIATVDPLQPIVTAPATLTRDATGLFTPVTMRQLLGLPANSSQADLEAALKKLAKDGVSGNECCSITVAGLTNEGRLLLPPGRYDIIWKATNAVGVSGEAIQQLNIQPLVSLSKSQVAIRGSEVSFSVVLNGVAPQYPLSVPYVIDLVETTATAAEHNLVNGIATFTQGQLEVAVPVSLPALSGVNDSALVVALGENLNAGVTNRHTILIRNGNIPPVVSMSIKQGGVNTSLVTPNGGPVVVTAAVTDANKNDTHIYDWSATVGLVDTDGNPADASRTFDPTGVTGSKQVQVTVTDQAGASVQASVYFRVTAALPVLNENTDTDQDGINDSLEGTGDIDDNGIPNYLDNMPSPNILPQQGNTTNAYLIECDPGVRCGLGLFARSSTSGGVQILNDEVGSLDDLIIDPAFEPVGGIFDFAIRDLPTPGQSVRVVIPQRSAIPANAVYRKFQKGRWVTFVEDADNAVHSTAGNQGYCPPPGTADWTPGLTAGHLCVQLTIEDGGANDDDGLVNSAVVDPGAVSVYFNTAPVAVNDSASTDDRTSISINVLANDKDVDNDILTVIAATAQQGSVSIEEGKMLKYIPKTGFSGTDSVSYRIRDSKGGEAVAVLSISITAYQNVVAEGKSSGGSSSGVALLLLALSVLWRRRAILLFALMAGQASAADIYLQLGAGQSSASAPAVTLPAGSSLTVDDTDTAYQFVAGYQLLDELAIEAGYQQLGDGTASISGSTLNPPSYQQLALAATPVLGDGISAGIRWQFLRVADWQFELPVGMLRWKADLNSTLGNSTVTDEVDGTDWYAGIAFNYQLSTNMGAGLSYQHIDLAPGGVQQYLLTVRYQF